MKKAVVLMTFILCFCASLYSQKQQDVSDTNRKTELLQYKAYELSLDTLRIVMVYYINQLREQENQIIKQQNVKLKKEGKATKPLLKELALYEPLNKVAQEFCVWKNENDSTLNGTHLNSNIHFGPDGKGPVTRIEEAGIKYIEHLSDSGVVRGANENIVTTNGNVKELIVALMNSKWHRTNLLSPFFTHIGIGYYPGSKILVQCFIAKE